MKALFAIGSLALVACAMPPQTAGTPPKPLGKAPLAYFADHCSRCHGDGGWGYPSGFADKMTDPDLLAELKSMAAGQGGAPLEDSDLAVQLALHRAISKQAPFASWTKHDGSKLEGEVTPDSAVTATAKGRDLTVTVKDGGWSLTLPADEEPSDLKLVVKAKDKSSTMDLSKQAYSLVDKASS